MPTKMKAASRLFQKTAMKAGRPRKSIEKAKGPGQQRKPRMKYVSQPAKMSSEKWKELQRGMAEKWPKPKYMENPAPVTGAYRDESYIAITRWTTDTKIRYRPHAKAPGSKSHIRYEKYAKATTVGEALKLGSFPIDWCYDYEHGFIKVVGGRLMEEAVDSSETDITTLDEVGQILAKWFIREAAKMLGMSLKELSENKDAKDALLLRMKRTVAEGKAKDILDECRAAGRSIVDADVLAVLRKWGFRKNAGRLNVMREGQNFVFSDTMGLVSDRKGCIVATTYTLPYPNVQRVLCRYLEDHQEKEVSGFNFTSINVNKNYAGRRHRDGSNMGPSMIKAFGSFTGGKLNYWPNDDRKITEVEELPSSDRVTMDLTKHIAKFDGRRAHEVDPFDGERYTLVYFTAPRNDRADPKVKAAMRDCGFKVPTPQDTKKLIETLAPPRGYEAGMAKVASGAQFKTWTATTGRGVKRVAR